MGICFYFTFKMTLLYCSGVPPRPAIRSKSVSYTNYQVTQVKQVTWCLQIETSSLIKYLYVSLNQIKLNILSISINQITVVKKNYVEYAVNFTVRVLHSRGILRVLGAQCLRICIHEVKINSVRYLVNLAQKMYFSSISQEAV